MKKLSVFFGSFLIALGAAVVLLVLIANFCGRGVCEQPWFKELYPLKKHFAREKNSPKIILIGGSSSFIGISGEKLREYTGLDNINFSMSIMMPMRFYLVDLEQNVKQGDIVVLPLEITNHYGETAEKNFSNFGISLLFGCMPEAQKTLSFRELCILYFQYGFSWINTSLFHEDGTLRRLFHSASNRQGVFDGIYNEEYVYARWAQQRAAAEKAPQQRLPIVSKYGDWLVDAPTASTDTAPFPLSITLSEEFLCNYNRIRELVKARGATLLLVWTNSYFYPEQTGVENFQKQLAAQDIPIYGRPEAMAFPKKFYHEPIHHMNCHGAELWTYELAKTICQATGRPLQKRHLAWPYVVFADDPGLYFPGVVSVQRYDTGIRISQNAFPLVLDLPENLQGKDLELNLIARPETPENPVFTAIMAAGTSCKLKEKRYQERMECRIHVPAACTNQDKLTLSCIVSGKAIGLERLFIQKQSPSLSVEFQSGFSAPEEWGRWTDGERAELTVTVPPEFRKKDVDLTWDILAFVHEKKPVCKFRIRTGDTLLKEVTTDHFSSRFSLQIPAEAADGERLPLTIEIEQPCSPKELGVSGDPRKLGIGIKSIAITELAE